MIALADDLFESTMTDIFGPGYGEKLIEAANTMLALDHGRLETSPNSLERLRKVKRLMDKLWGHFALQQKLGQGEEELVKKGQAECLGCIRVCIDAIVKMERQLGSKTN